MRQEEMMFLQILIAIKEHISKHEGIKGEKRISRRAKPATPIKPRKP